MLGSFPPQKKRWSMDFFYPNLNNDMWRIVGLIFFGNKEYFLNETKKAFSPERLTRFLTERGIALYDTATHVQRLDNNASDKSLKIVQATNIRALLDKVPHCTAIATTGQKASETLCQQMQIAEPKIGECVTAMYGDRKLRIYRMPSSSRAYPLKLERKAEIYQQIFQELHIE